MALQKLKSHNAEPYVKSLDRVITSGALPVIQTLISNAIQTTVSARRRIRVKALASVRTRSVRIALLNGDCFSAPLFEEGSIKLAEECFKAGPPTIKVFASGHNSRGRGRDYQPGGSSGHSPSFRGRGAGSHRRGRGRGRGRYPRSSRGNTRGNFRPSGFRGRGGSNYKSAQHQFSNAPQEGHHSASTPRGRRGQGFPAPQ